VDESPYNGTDDDGDGLVDEWDEVDQFGLVNYSFHCCISTCSTRPSPQSDPELYRIMACEPPEECYETNEDTDVREMMSSGPFDWPTGRMVRVAVAYIFADALGEDPVVEVYGDPPRPDPNDPIFADLLAVAMDVQSFFDGGFSDTLDFFQVFGTKGPEVSNRIEGRIEVETKAESSSGVSWVELFYSSPIALVDLDNDCRLDIFGSEIRLPSACPGPEHTTPSR